MISISWTLISLAGFQCTANPEYRLLLLLPANGMNDHLHAIGGFVFHFVLRHFSYSKNQHFVTLAPRDWVINRDPLESPALPEALSICECCEMWCCMYFAWHCCTRRRPDLVFAHNILSWCRAARRHENKCSHDFAEQEVMYR